MKKKVLLAILTLFSFVITGLLLIDTIKLQLNVLNPDGAGTSIYLFGGIWEVIDPLAYEAAGKYLLVLWSLVVIFALISLILAYKTTKKYIGNKIR